MKRVGVLLAAAGLAAAAPLPEATSTPAPAAAASSTATTGGLPGFQGSAACASCHVTEHQQWKGSAHARTAHEPSIAEKELLERSLLCGDGEATQVLGERRAKRFLAKSAAEPGRHVLLPCRYDVGPAEWVPIHGSDWRDLTFEKACGACHSAGFSSDDLSWRELGVGCEACHGPAARHGDFTSRGGMIAFRTLTAKAEVTLCASCHLQGGRSKTTGLHFARDYTAGDDLFADYQFDWATLDGKKERSGHPIDIHQKLLIRQATLPAAGAGANGLNDLRCTSCHEFHQAGSAKHEKLPRQEFCHLCHAKTDFKLKDYDRSCDVCEF